MATVADIIQRDTRANQPAATTVSVGTLYYVTDEQVTERSNGTTWDDVTDAGGGSYTDEQAQDAIGTILADTATVNFTYTDATPEIKADVLPGGIKLDDLGAPDDNTDRDVSTSAHGLVPKITGSDGHVLQKSGAGAVWAAGGGGGLTAQDAIDLAWQKKFFSDASLLPATERIAASLATFPTETGNPVGTFTKLVGYGTLPASGMVYWDLGALRSTVLLVVAGYAMGGGASGGIVVSAAAPTTITPDGYLFDRLVSGSTFRLGKFAATSYSQLASVTDPFVAQQLPLGMAFYYDDATGALKGLVRFASGGWFQFISTTDSTYTTMRYVSVRFDNTGTAQLILPFAAWSD
jgi:hypothetical protein